MFLQKLYHGPEAKARKQDEKSPISILLFFANTSKKMQFFVVKAKNKS